MHQLKLSLFIYTYTDRVQFIYVVFECEVKMNKKRIVVGLGRMYRVNGWRGGIIGGGIFWGKVVKNNKKYI